ncbi:hypothetical protein GCM10027454_03850 [Algoriphagus aestuariicola]
MVAQHYEKKLIFLFHKNKKAGNELVWLLDVGPSMIDETKDRGRKSGRMKFGGVPYCDWDQRVYIENGKA